ncbi:unnamed protein product [Toxocara canis]|uniref:Uncharacterized protein n=1 Tax=Toxocara canis TaxID=6265 RepID=A0A183UGW3_TOXCA|nr:unnamed protein product [Toxocara canis]
MITRGHVLIAFRYRRLHTKNFLWTRIWRTRQLLVTRRSRSVVRALLLRPPEMHLALSQTACTSMQKFCNELGAVQPSRYA